MNELVQDPAVRVLDRLAESKYSIEDVKKLLIKAVLTELEANDAKVQLAIAVEGDVTIDHLSDLWQDYVNTFYSVYVATDPLEIANLYVQYRTLLSQW